MQVDDGLRLRTRAIKTGMQESFLGRRVAVDMAAIGIEARDAGGIQVTER